MAAIVQAGARQRATDAMGFLHKRAIADNYPSAAVTQNSTPASACPADERELLETAASICRAVEAGVDHRVRSGACRSREYGACPMKCLYPCPVALTNDGRVILNSYTIGPIETADVLQSGLAAARACEILAAVNLACFDFDGTITTGDGFLPFVRAATSRYRPRAVSLTRASAARARPADTTRATGPCASERCRAPAADRCSGARALPRSRSAP
jgi:hypothetical protein